MLIHIFVNKNEENTQMQNMPKLAHIIVSSFRIAELIDVISSRKLLNENTIASKPGKEHWSSRNPSTEHMGKGSILHVSWIS